ncbi:MAG: methyltransferase [Salibacteraceae bacterium]
MNFKTIVKSVVKPFVDTYHSWLHRNPVEVAYKEVRVNVVPGVFSPKAYSSTTIFLDYLVELPLSGKTVLELGCGSGLISGYCASQGAIVTASDINDAALTELSAQARDNNWDIIPVYSNLFENLHFHFDYIFINPPYKPLASVTEEEMNVNAGVNFEYFDELFNQLKVRTLRDTKVLLFLPEEAELFSICRRSKQHHLKLKTQKVMHKGMNTGTVYRVEAEN